MTSSYEDDWFPNPLDSMPVATDKSFDWEDTAPSEYEPPDDDSYSSRHKTTPDYEKGAEEVVTMHEKMYRMATKNGGSWLGGSEICHGGSEQAWWTDGEQKFTPENDPYGGY